MKKFFLAASILMVTAMTSTYAQNYVSDNKNQNAVSDFTKNQFSMDFPNATDVRFAKTKDYDEVSYTKKGRKYIAYYDYNNQLVGTIRQRSFNDLPAVAQKKITDNYPNYAVVKIIKYKVNSDNETFIDNDTDTSLLGAPSENNSNYFVELQNGDKSIVLMVDLSGEVNYFTALK
jgi:hypothetical protein